MRSAAADLFAEFKSSGIILASLRSSRLPLHHCRAGRERACVCVCERVRERERKKAARETDKNNGLRTESFGGVPKNSLWDNCDDDDEHSISGRFTCRPQERSRVRESESKKKKSGTKTKQLFLSLWSFFATSQIKATTVVRILLTVASYFFLCRVLVDFVSLTRIFFFQNNQDLNPLPIKILCILGFLQTIDLVLMVCT